MTIEEFANVLIEQLCNEYYVIGSLTTTTCTRSDGMEYYGIMYTGGDVRPIVNVSSLYGKYTEGTFELEDCIESVHESLQSRNCNRDVIQGYKDIITNFDNVKGRLRLRVFNEVACKGVLFRKWRDLAINVYIDFDNTGYTTGITEALVKYWGISFDEIYNIARENTLKAGWICKPLEDVIKDILQDPEVETSWVNEAEGKSIPIWVITDTSNAFGAVFIVYEEVLKEAAEKLDCDFYILPSSIHELMILPYDSVVGYEVLKAMVYDVNRTTLQEGDFLTDTVYLYHKDTGIIESF